MEDHIHSDAYQWGKQAGRDIIAKRKPRSLSDLGKLLKVIEKHVEKKYPYSDKWKLAYISGAEEEFTKHFTKLQKEGKVK
jgi:hypothetical protein